MKWNKNIYIKIVALHEFSELQLIKFIKECNTNYNNNRS